MSTEARGLGKYGSANVAGFAFSAASSVVDSFNTYNQGQMSAASLKAQRAINSSNLKMEEASYDWAIERQLESNKRDTATMQALFGKSGVTFDGSQVEVYQDNLYNMELDVLALEIDKLSAINASRTRDDFMRIEQKYVKRAALINATAGGVLKLFSSATNSFGGKSGGADSTTSFSTSRGTSSAPLSGGTYPTWS